jgi:excisionase family DNA binding protein
MNDFYTTKEVTEIFRVHRNTVLDWIKKDKIKAFRVDKRWRIPKEEVDRITKVANNG